MRVTERESGDVAELERRTRDERDALQRDRYRSALMAIGGAEAEQIAATVGRSRRAVQAWAYAYRDGGVEALRPAKRKGRSPKLPRDKEEAFASRMDAGPAAAGQGVCTLRGRDAVRILADEFKVAYTLDGAYDLLHRLGFSCLKPRPVHEDNDPVAAAAFKACAPFLSTP